MSINGIHGTASTIRIAPSTVEANASAASAAPAAGSRASTVSSTSSSPASTTSSETVKLDEATQQPLPPRFPWLSRLSVQLEAASNKRSTFPTQILGDNVDKKA